MKTLQTKNRRIGIIGGMGPAASLYLQEKLIGKAGASKDQDHLAVVCYSNPKIRDRTLSLARDEGAAYTKDIIESIRMLERMDVSEIVIACNTAHARYDLFQSVSKTKIIHMPQLVVDHVGKFFGARARIGLLGTNGLVRARVYESCAGFKHVQWIFPTPKQQKLVMESIYGIKSGDMEGPLQKLDLVIRELRKAGAEILVLGCTDLSPHTERLRARHPIDFIDPMEIVARSLL